MSKHRNALNQCIFCSFRSYTRTSSSASVLPSKQLTRSIASQTSRRTARNRNDESSSGTLQWRFTPSKEDFARPRERQRESSRQFRNHPERKDARILRAIAKLNGDLSLDPAVSALGFTFKQYRYHVTRFQQYVQACFAGDEQDPELLDRLRRLPAFDGRENSIEGQIRYEIYDRCLKVKGIQINPVDEINPSQSCYIARSTPRHIHLHIGPTNSGKTYHALKRLEQAKSGLYCGPLRLLAHEVYMRLNAKGITCDLVTGDEIKQSSPTDRAPLLSCTVEMCPLTPREDPTAVMGMSPYDVAVIDEIQMLGSVDRGWAWTMAFLGVCANEVHVCGEERSEQLVRGLAAGCGDKITVHRYERLSPLELAPTHLGSLKNLQKGDCIVSFSVVALHSLRQEIEKMTGKKCAIIYGSLPPETRAQQARLFNDPNNDYDFLVASNAIGMGLNLEIKRMVFHTTQRRIGNAYDSLSVPELKQIAGRAGRYSSATRDMGQDAAAAVKSKPDKDAKTLGLVTTLEPSDYHVLANAMNGTAEPMTAAGFMPTDRQIQRYAQKWPTSTPLSYLLLRMYYSASYGDLFFACDLAKSVSIADVLEPVKELSMPDRLVFLAAPIEPRREGEPELAQAFARAVVSGVKTSPLQFEQLELGLLSDEFESSREYLKRLEMLHKAIIIHNWLAYRFPFVFCFIDLGQHIRNLVEQRIEKVLFQLSFDYETLQRLERQRSNQLKARLRKSDYSNNGKRGIAPPDASNRMSIQDLLAVDSARPESNL